MSTFPLTPSTPPTPDTAIPSTDTDADRSPSADAHPAHTAHSAHPDALRERAVALLCEGLRSPAIAVLLGVSERTVRAWLADARRAFAQQDVAADAISLHERLALAVERQLAIAAAAWQSYHHAVLLDQLALDHHRVIAEQAPNRRTLTGEVHPPPPPPRPSTASARFLSVALAAQREAARLQGCYDYPTRPFRVHLTAAISTSGRNGNRYEAIFCCIDTSISGNTSNRASPPAGLRRHTASQLLSVLRFLRFLPVQSS